MEHCGLSVRAKVSMDFEFLFPVSEGAVAGVGGVGDVQNGLEFVRKKIRQVGFEATQSTTKTSVLELLVGVALE